MSIQTTGNTKFELKSADAKSNKFEINGIDLSLVPDGIKKVNL